MNKQLLKPFLGKYMQTSHKMLLTLISLPTVLFSMNPETTYPAYPLQAVLECYNSKNFIEKTKPLSPELLEESLVRAPQQIQGLARLLGNSLLFKAYKPKDLVLKGPYGTGKRTLAQALAQKNNLTYTMINAYFLGNFCKKSGEERLLHLLDLSLQQKSEPHIMIVNQAENFEEKDASSGETATLWQLLQKYRSDRNIYFILTQTEHYNLHHLIEQECTIIPISNPDAPTRKKILTSFISNYKENTLSEADIEQLTQKNAGLNFDLLDYLCEEAGRHAVRTYLQQKKGLEENTTEFFEAFKQFPEISAELSRTDFEIILKTSDQFKQAHCNKDN
jgi:SpoVK/Ycf46/Vps4 family AAA+-type ATPase